MTTIKVNERTKAGKLFLEMARLFSKDKKGVEVIEDKKKEKSYTISKNIPNAETLKVFKANDKRGTKGLKKYDSTEKLFEDLGI